MEGDRDSNCMGKVDATLILMLGGGGGGGERGSQEDEAPRDN